MPDADPIVAIAVLPLLQVPPDDASDNVVRSPTHRLTGVEGVIVAGSALTVTEAVAKHDPIV